MGDQAEFGCQHHLIPAALQGTGEQLLVDVGAVDLGGVDQRDAQIESAVNRANGLGVVKAADGVGGGHPHRAQADTADLQIGEVSLFHGTFSCRRRGFVRSRRELPGYRGAVYRVELPPI